MDVTVNLVLRIALAIFLTMMALASIVFFMIVIAAVVGDKREQKMKKMDRIDDQECPCFRCRYFDKESYTCLKEDNYANGNHA